MPWSERLQLEDLLEADLYLEEEFLEVGNGPFGRRKVVRLKRGTATFLTRSLKGLQAKVDAAADFALYSEQNEIVLIDVRSVLEVDLGNDGKAHIYVHYANDVRLTAEVRRQISAGRTIPFATSDFIVTPRFEVGVPEGKESPQAADLARLVHTRVIAHAELSPLRIKYRMYEVVNPTAPRS